MKRLAPRIEHFTVDGEPHRVRGLSDNSGVRIAGKVGYRKWVLEHSNGKRWVEDGYIVLPNTAGSKKARSSFGV